MCTAKRRFIYDVGMSLVEVSVARDRVALTHSHIMEVGYCNEVLGNGNFPLTSGVAWCMVSSGSLSAAGTRLDLVTSVGLQLLEPHSVETFDSESIE